MTSATGSGNPEVAFCRSRLKTFSTSMIASSTNSPMAIASPPSVIVLILIPKYVIVMNAATSDRGIASRLIKVVRKFQRKRNKNDGYQQTALRQRAFNIVDCSVDERCLLESLRLDGQVAGQGRLQGR